MPPDREIALRPARADDARRVWRWRNEPKARAASFHTDPISWTEHAAWFAARLGDPTARILVAETPVGSAIGYVRFSLSGGEAEISVGLDPARRGEGLGWRVIRAACEELFEAQPRAARPGRVVARVKPGNEASLRAFRHAGFADASPDRAGATVLELPAPSGP